MGTYNNIHIGEIIQNEVVKQEISFKRIILHFDCNKEKIIRMYNKKHISTEDLLSWCTLLRIDLFRLFSGYLILHRGISSKPSVKNSYSELIIRKNVYTHEIKKFIVDKIRTKQITVTEAIKKYNIPKTTIYKWLHQI